MSALALRGSMSPGNVIPEARRATMTCLEMYPPARRGPMPPAVWAERRRHAQCRPPGPVATTASGVACHKRALAYVGRHCSAGRALKFPESRQTTSATVEHDRSRIAMMCVR
jgi:hypothetical protein